METTVLSMEMKPTITIYGIGYLASYERYLSVTTEEGTVQARMLAPWGPSLRASVYSVGDNQIAILGAARDYHFIALRPLRTIQGKDIALPSDRWVYLGAFDHYHERRTREAGGNREVSRFIAAAEQAECIPTYLGGDFGGPYRGQYTQDSSCPEFGAAPPGPVIGARSGP